MATSSTVWFANGNTEKWFPTQAKALEYEKQQEVIKKITDSGLVNEDAAKKIAKLLTGLYDMTLKPV
jgi:hypothetical protein